MIRRFLFLLPGAQVLLLAVAVHAQGRPNGLFLTSPLGLSSGYDQGFIVGSRTLDDTTTIITGPKVAWMETTHRTEFVADYQPEVELFARNTNLDAMNHVASLLYRYQINSRWSFQAGNLFLSTMDSTRQLANSLLLLPRGQFLQNATYAGLNYRVNELTKISFRLDNAFTDTNLPGALAGRLDGVTTAGTATVDRILTSHHKLSGSYSFLHSHPLDPEVSGSPTNVNLFNAGYTYEAGPGLIAQLGAGVVKGRETSFIGAATIQKKLREMWVAAGYQRYLSFFGGLAPLGPVVPGAGPFAGGVTPDSVYQVASVRVWGQLSRRFGLEGTAQGALNQADPRFGSVKSLIGQVRATYKMTERTSWFVSAEHYGQNSNSFLYTPMSRNRYFGGIEIALRRPPDPDNVRNRHGKIPQDSIATDPVPEEK